MKAVLAILLTLLVGCCSVGSAETPTCTTVEGTAPDGVPPSPAWSDESGRKYYFSIGSADFQGIADTAGLVRFSFGTAKLQSGCEHLKIDAVNLNLHELLGLARANGTFTTSVRMNFAIYGGPVNPPPDQSYIDFTMTLWSETLTFRYSVRDGVVTGKNVTK